MCLCVAAMVPEELSLEHGCRQVKMRTVFILDLMMTDGHLQFMSNFSTFAALSSISVT